MASITIETNGLYVVHDGYERIYNMRVMMAQTWEDENDYRGVTIPRIFIKRITDFRFTVFGGVQEVQAYVLHPGEEHKLPNPLPRGVVLRDCTAEGDGACKMLLPDWEWVANSVYRFCIENHPFEHFPSDRTDVWHRSWSRLRVRMAKAITATLDLRDADDRYTKYDRAERYYRMNVIDGDLPHLPPRDVGYSNELNENGMGGLEEEWARETDYVYKDEMDENLKGPALARFRKALGSTLHTDTGKEHRFKGRKLDLDEDERVPFPDECKFIAFGVHLVALEIDRAGRYRKPLDSTFFTRDCVFIHRAGSYTRFLFWEHRTMTRQVGEKLKFTVLYPVVVADVECKKFLPVSPMRGMDPRITKAIARNPYLASALQHAINRRTYLQSRLPQEPTPIFDVPGVPVLLRSGTDTRLRPGKGSKTGRAAVRDGTFRCDNQTLHMVQGLGSNDFEFGATVQRVAEPAPRRRLQLDM